MGSGFIQISISVIRIITYEFLKFLPYVVVGVLVGEILKITSWTKLFYKFTNKSPLISNLIASILGIASPICTIGTVPVCIQLYRSGVKISPLLTFLTSSILMNPQMLIYTWGFISPKMAIFRIVTVLIVSLSVGFISSLFPPNSIVNNKVEINTELAHEIEEKPSFKTITFIKFAKNCWGSFEYIAFYMLIGIIIGVFINSFVLENNVYRLFAPDKWYSVIFSALLGIPLYQCGGMTIPIINSMMREGMGYGQALTFFLVGPVTNMAPIMAIATILKKKYVVGYITIIIIIALIIGYGFAPITNILYNLTP